MSDSHTPNDLPVPERPALPSQDAVGEPLPAPTPLAADTPLSSVPGPASPAPADHGQGAAHGSAPAQVPVADGPAAKLGDPGVHDFVGRLAGGVGARSLAWALAALLFLALGVVGSLVAAHTVARNDAGGARRASKATATALAATAKTALEREQQLGVSASTFLAAEPKATAAQFERWARWAETLKRYPELDQLGLVTLVRAPELPAFHGISPAGVPLHISPAGARAYYCLAGASLTRSAGELAPAGLDYCYTRTGLLRTRDSKGGYYAQSTTGGGKALEVLLPVYRGNQAPTVRIDRQAAFVGWVREVFAVGVLAHGLVPAGSPGGIVMSFKRGTADLAVGAGVVHQGAPSTTVDVHDGWTVEGFGAAVNAAVLNDGDAVAVLVAGLLASVLMAALLFSLGRGERPRTARPSPVPTDGGQLYDRLTGLPTRALVLDRAECMLARAGRQPGLLVGALFIDLDWFEGVNERLGREAGDQVLKTVARRLETVVRAGDHVGRLAADEFVLLVETAARGARLDSLARRVVEALHKPFELEGVGPGFVMTASIGVAFGRYATADDLLRDARLALHAAKSAGKDRYTLFNANMRSVIEGRGVLEAELNRALGEKQFFLLYEPIYDLATGQVAGMEALLRWLHPKQGVLAPSDFIPLAEETGLSVPIGRWMLEEACQRGAAWNVAGYPIGVSIEVSRAQLNRDGFVTDLRRALQQSGIQPELVTLEVAETTVLRDVETAVERLEEIKRLGVKIAIDDFGGSGYAYHSDLRRLPLDFLAVDRGSLAASEDEEYRSWLLEAIMIVGRELALPVIAKSIESWDQMGALQEMGCTMAQGPLMGKPVPTGNLETALVSRLPVARTDVQKS